MFKKKFQNSDITYYLVEPLVIILFSYILKIFLNFRLFEGRVRKTPLDVKK